MVGDGEPSFSSMTVVGGVRVACCSLLLSINIVRDEEAENIGIFLITWGL
jgi:hypothetical protein